MPEERVSLPEPVPPSLRGRIRREPIEIGRSRLGAPLHCFGGEKGRPRILVAAGQHGDEGEGVVLLSAALRCVPEGALAVDVVPALNPDGLALGTRGNAAGVDLNRNLPSRSWQASETAYRWTLDAPRDVRLSPGPKPASEPESAALVALVGRRDYAVVLSIHAPLALVDDPALTRLGAYLSLRTGLDRVTDVGYPTPGSLGEWGRETGRPIVTWELPDGPREQILRAYVSVLYAVLVGAGE